MKKRVLSLLLAVCMVLGMVPMNAFKAEAAAVVTVYRNPVKDPAGNGFSFSMSDLEGSLASIAAYQVRDTTAAAWKEQIMAATGLDGKDVHYYVETGSLGYVSITEAHMGLVNCGRLFGWGSVTNGKCTFKTNSEKVKIVDPASLFITSYYDGEFTVDVNGYVGVTWKVGDTSYTDKVSLDYAINNAENDGLTTDTDYAAALAAAKKLADDKTAASKSTTYTFEGWDYTGDGKVDDQALLGYTIDVTALDSTTLAAETVEGTVFTAVYKETPKTYTVTWVNDNGVELEKDENVEYGATPRYDGATPVAQNTEVGKSYTFSGWTPEVSTVEGNVIYKATYDVTDITYTVTWVNDDGGVLETDPDVKHGTLPTYDGATPVAQNTEEGKTYTFTGWTPEVVKVSGDVTYTATYSTATTFYTVTFDAKGGSAVADATVGHGETVAANTTTTLDGYKFAGWMLNGTVIDLSTYVVESDIELVAKWVKQYTVKFTNGDTLVKTVTVDDGSKVTAPTEEVKKDNAVFTGWYADGANEPFDFENTAITADITLDAGWLNLYTVTFEANDGEGSMDDQTFTEGVSQALAVNSFTHSGYKFIGWSTVNGGTEVTYTDGKEISVDKNLTLYAVWEEIPAVPTTIQVTNHSVKVIYGSFTVKDLLDKIAPKVMANGVEVVDAIVAVDDITKKNVGTYKVTLTYAGTDEYERGTATAEVIIEKAAASVVVSSQTVKYGNTVVDPIKANCGTIDILVGLDAHDETDLLGLAQVSAPEELLFVLGFAAGKAGIDLSNLSLSDVEKLLELAEGENAVVDKVSALLAEYKDILTKLVNTLKKVQAKLPMDSELRISVVADVTMPTNMGVYLVASMAADTNYTSDMDAGYLIITPNGIQTALTWDDVDDNYVITLDKNADFNYGATATVNGATAEGVDYSDAAAQSHVEYLFVGVDDNGELLLDRCTDATIPELTVGAYAQVAYIANWDNVMYYAEPLVRPIVVTPNVADVAILDGNGNENYAQVYTYGDEIELTVTVDGVEAPVEGLTVKYIGSDTTVDGWYRDEVPTDAGVYTVVAVYTEKAGEELVKAGAAVGVLIINPADAEVGLEDAQYCVDGEEHFATITNEALDYITVAIDRENNIAYVNLPDDTEDHVDRLVSMLPAEAEELANNFLDKYADFDGSVQTSTIKAELTEIIEKVVAADMTNTAVAKAEELVDLLVAEVEANVDIQAMIDKVKSELNTIKDQISSEIPDEIEAELVDYLKAVVTVTEDGVDVDTEKMKADLKAKVAELAAELPASVVAELDEMINEIIAKVESHVDVEAIESKASEIAAAVEELTVDDAKELVVKLIGAIYGYVDLTEVKALVNEVVAKVEAQGYVDYAKNMVANIAGMYEGEIDTAEVEAAIDALAAKIEEKINSGSIEKDDLYAIEGYVDDILASLITVVDQIPEGTIIFGENPSAVGVYDCYAINISANYKAEFTEAELVICDPEENYVKTVVRTEPTCTEDGSIVTTYTCTCESATCGCETYSTTVVLPATGHDYGEGVVTKEPTCTEPGVKTYTCANDATHTYTEEIAAFGHKPGNEIVENYVAATATKDGSYDLVVYCTVCGEELSRETVIIKAQPETPTPTPTPTPAPVPEAPDSGDHSNLWLWAVAMMMSLVCAGTAFVQKKRRTR